MGYFVTAKHSKIARKRRIYAKKRPYKQSFRLLARSFSYYEPGLFFFALFSKNIAALGQQNAANYPSFTFACAAASLAIGTRNGEQDT